MIESRYENFLGTDQVHHAMGNHAMRNHVRRGPSVNFLLIHKFSSLSGLEIYFKDTKYQITGGHCRKTMLL